MHNPGRFRGGLIIAQRNFMQRYFVQPAVRRWLVLGAASLLVRALAYLPIFAPWALGFILVGYCATLATTFGLAVLLGRQLRARGRLAFWEVPGVAIMAFVLFLTDPLMSQTAHPPGWLYTLAWAATSASLFSGVLAYMAGTDRLRQEPQGASLMEVRRDGED